MKQKKFTLFWLTGQAEIVRGDNIADAMNKAGYEQGSLRALDFYAKGDVMGGYYFDKEMMMWRNKKLSEQFSKI